MDFDLTRRENDEQLLPQLESIRSGENFQALVPFAKAYLGLFYVIDSELAAVEKIKLLANKELADAVLDGFKASLLRADIPTVEQIGEAMAKQEEFSEGYVILAGLDLLTAVSMAEIESLKQAILESAIAFQFSNKTNHPNQWFDYLLKEHKEKALPALGKYWSVMLQNKATYIPGRNLVLSDTPDIEVVQHTVLLLLEHWQNCKAKVLFQLLQLAFKYAEANEFLAVTERVLSRDENTDEKLNEKTRLYWLATAFLLAPEKYSAKLSDYVGRVKLKIMPLLDFVTLIIRNKDKVSIDVTEKLVAHLLRMIAPIFPPQHHVYGALGGLDINSRNVMLMFYTLVCSDNKEATKEIKVLRKARVMKIYSGVIDNVLELHMRKNNEEGFVLPDFDSYIKYLVDNHKLDGRSNKFDLH